MNTRLRFRLVTFIVITTFLCQDIAFAKGPGMLMPESKVRQIVEELTPDLRRGWELFKQDPDRLTVPEMDRLRIFLQENWDSIPEVSRHIFLESLLEGILQGAGCRKPAGGRFEYIWAGDRKMIEIEKDIDGLPIQIRVYDKDGDILASFDRFGNKHEEYQYELCGNSKVLKKVAITHIENAGRIILLNYMMNTKEAKFIIHIDEGEDPIGHLHIKYKTGSEFPCLDLDSFEIYPPSLFNKKIGKSVINWIISYARTKYPDSVNYYCTLIYNPWMVQLNRDLVKDIEVEYEEEIWGNYDARRILEKFGPIAIKYKDKEVGYIDKSGDFISIRSVSSKWDVSYEDGRIYVEDKKGRPIDGVEMEYDAWPNIRGIANPIVLVKDNEEGVLYQYQSGRIIAEVRSQPSLESHKFRKDLREALEQELLVSGFNEGRAMQILNRGLSWTDGKEIFLESDDVFEIAARVLNRILHKKRDEEITPEQVKAVTEYHETLHILLRANRRVINRVNEALKMKSRKRLFECFNNQYGIYKTDEKLIEELIVSYYTEKMLVNSLGLLGNDGQIVTVEEIDSRIIEIIEANAQALINSVNLVKLRYGKALNQLNEARIAKKMQREKLPSVVKTEPPKLERGMTVRVNGMEERGLGEIVGFRTQKEKDDIVLIQFEKDNVPTSFLCSYLMGRMMVLTEEEPLRDILGWIIGQGWNLGKFFTEARKETGWLDVSDYEILARLNIAEPVRIEVEKRLIENGGDISTTAVSMGLIEKQLLELAEALGIDLPQSRKSEEIDTNAGKEQMRDMLLYNKFKDEMYKPRSFRIVAKPNYKDGKLVGSYFWFGQVKETGYKAMFWSKKLKPNTICRIEYYFSKRLGKWICFVHEVMGDGSISEKPVTGFSGRMAKDGTRLYQFKKPELEEVYMEKIGGVTSPPGKEGDDKVLKGLKALFGTDSIEEVMRWIKDGKISLEELSLLVNAFSDTDFFKKDIAEFMNSLKLNETYPGRHTSIWRRLPISTHKRFIERLLGELGKLKVAIESGEGEILRNLGATDSGRRLISYLKGIRGDIEPRHLRTEIFLQGIGRLPKVLLHRFYIEYLFLNKREGAGDLFSYMFERLGFEIIKVESSMELPVEVVARILRREVVHGKDGIDADGFIRKGKKSFKLFRNLRTEDFVDVTDGYKDFYRIFMERNKEKIPQGVLGIAKGIIEEPEYKIYEFPGIVVHIEDYFLGWHDMGNKIIYIASGLLEFLQRFYPTLQDEYKLHELFCPLFSHDEVGSHYAAISFISWLFKNHYAEYYYLDKGLRAKEPGREYKGLMAVFIRAYIDIQTALGAIRRNIDETKKRNKDISEKIEGWIRIVRRPDINVVLDEKMARWLISDLSNIINQYEIGVLRPFIGILKGLIQKGNFDFSGICDVLSSYLDKMKPELRYVQDIQDKVEGLVKDLRPFNIDEVFNELSRLKYGCPNKGISFCIEKIIGGILSINRQNEIYAELIRQKRRTLETRIDGYIYQGFKSKKDFNSQLEEIRQNDITEKYKARIRRILKKANLPILRYRIYGFNSIVRDRDDFFMGWHNIDSKEIFIAEDVVAELEAHGQPSLVDEYILHEIICPTLGHYKAIELQKKLFQGHYSEEVLAMHRKGLLGKVLREIIDRRTMIVLYKMIRAEKGGGISQDKKKIRRKIWEKILAYSFEGRKRIRYLDRNRLPRRISDEYLKGLGHIVLKGRLIVGGRVDFRHLWSRFTDYSGSEYELEIRDGVPLRIFFTKDYSAVEFLPIVDNKTGQVIGVHCGKIKKDRFKEFKDVTVYTYLGRGEGGFGLGGEKGITKFIDHPDEKVKVLVKDGIVYRCTSLESSLDEEFSLIWSKSQSRYVGSFLSRMYPTEFNKLDEDNRIHNCFLDKAGFLSIGGRDAWLGFGKRYRDMPVNITSILNPTGKEAFVVSAEVVKNGKVLATKRVSLIYKVPENSPPKSFERGELFDVFRRFYENRLMCEDGTILGTYIVSGIHLGGDFLDVGGYIGGFAKFPNAEVEIKFIDGKARFVKFIKDQKGEPILDKQDNPLVIDLVKGIRREMAGKFYGRVSRRKARKKVKRDKSLTVSKGERKKVQRAKSLTVSKGERKKVERDKSLTVSKGEEGDKNDEPKKEVQKKEGVFIPKPLPLPLYRELEILYTADISLDKVDGAFGSFVRESIGYFTSMTAGDKFNGYLERLLARPQNADSGRIILGVAGSEPHGVYRPLGRNAVRYCTSIYPSKTVAIVFDEGYINLLIKYKERFPNAVRWLFMERLTHELCHDDEKGILDKERIAEENIILLNDMRLYKFFVYRKDLDKEIEDLWDTITEGEREIIMQSREFFEMLKDAVETEMIWLEDGSKPLEARRLIHAKIVTPFVKKTYVCGYEGKAYPARRLKDGNNSAVATPGMYTPEQHRKTNERIHAVVQGLQGLNVQDIRTEVWNSLDNETRQALEGVALFLLPPDNSEYPYYLRTESYVQGPAFAPDLRKAGPLDGRLEYQVAHAGSWEGRGRFVYMTQQAFMELPVEIVARILRREARLAKERYLERNDGEDVEKNREEIIKYLSTGGAPKYLINEGHPLRRFLEDNIGRFKEYVQRKRSVLEGSGEQIQEQLRILKNELFENLSMEMDGLGDFTLTLPELIGLWSIVLDSMELKVEGKKYDYCVRDRYNIAEIFILAYLRRFVRYKILDMHRSLLNDLRLPFSNERDSLIFVRKFKDTMNRIVGSLEIINNKVRGDVIDAVRENFNTAFTILNSSIDIALGKDIPSMDTEIPWREYTDSVEEILEEVKMFESLKRIYPRLIERLRAVYPGSEFVGFSVLYGILITGKLPNGLPGLVSAMKADGIVDKRDFRVITSIAEVVEDVAGEEITVEGKVLLTEAFSIRYLMDTAGLKVQDKSLACKFPGEEDLTLYEKEDIKRFIEEMGCQILEPNQLLRHKLFKKVIDILRKKTSGIHDVIKMALIENKQVNVNTKILDFKEYNGRPVYVRISIVDSKNPKRILFPRRGDNLGVPIYPTFTQVDDRLFLDLNIPSAFINEPSVTPEILLGLVVHELSELLLGKLHPETVLDEMNYTNSKIPPRLQWMIDELGRKALKRNNHAVRLLMQLKEPYRFAGFYLSSISYGTKKEIEKISTLVSKRAQMWLDFIGLVKKGNSNNAIKVNKKTKDRLLKVIDSFVKGDLKEEGIKGLSEGMHVCGIFIFGKTSWFAFKKNGVRYICNGFGEGNEKTIVGLVLHEGYGLCLWRFSTVKGTFKVFRLKPFLENLVSIDMPKQNCFLEEVGSEKGTLEDVFKSEEGKGSEDAINKEEAAVIGEKGTGRLRNTGIESAFRDIGNVIKRYGEFLRQGVTLPLYKGINTLGLQDEINSIKPFNFSVPRRMRKIIVSIESNRLELLIPKDIGNSARIGNYWDNGCGLFIWLSNQEGNYFAIYKADDCLGCWDPKRKWKSIYAKPIVKKADTLGKAIKMARRYMERGINEEKGREKARNIIKEYAEIMRVGGDLKEIKDKIGVFGEVSFRVVKGGFVNLRPHPKNEIQFRRLGRHGEVFKMRLVWNEKKGLLVVFVSPSRKRHRVVVYLLEKYLEYDEDTKIRKEFHIIPIAVGESYHEVMRRAIITEEEIHKKLMRVINGLGYRELGKFILGLQEPDLGLINNVRTQLPRLKEILDGAVNLGEESELYKVIQGLVTDIEGLTSPNEIWQRQLFVSKEGVLGLRPGTIIRLDVEDGKTIFFPEIGHSINGPVTIEFVLKEPLLLNNLGDKNLKIALEFRFENKTARKAFFIHIARNSLYLVHPSGRKFTIAELEIQGEGILRMDSNSSSPISEERFFGNKVLELKDYVNSVVELESPDRQGDIKERLKTRLMQTIQTDEKVPHTKAMAWHLLEQLGMNMGFKGKVVYSLNTIRLSKDINEIESLKKIVKRTRGRVFFYAPSDYILEEDYSFLRESIVNTERIGGLLNSGELTVYMLGESDKAFLAKRYSVLDINPWQFSEKYNICLMPLSGVRDMELDILIGLEILRNGGEIAKVDSLFKSILIAMVKGWLVDNGREPSRENIEAILKTEIPKAKGYKEEINDSFKHIKDIIISV